MVQSLTSSVLSRRTVFGVSVAGVALAQTPQPATISADRGSRVDLVLVKDFVGKAHRPPVDALRTLLAQEPGLLNAAWDWGRGDWETALAAASHVGNRANANFLLDRGARPDLFAATMLGELATVKAWVSFAPACHQVPGPHGIPLLSHALVGGPAADPIFHLLLEAGADVKARSNNGTTPLMVAAAAGRREAVEALLARGADARARTQDGRTALSMATKAGREDVVRMLSASE
jgi:hypothetical protein